MLNTIRAVVRDGKIELLEPVHVPDGTGLLVTILPNEETQFWLGCSQSALDRVWNNPEDDAYGESAQCNNSRIRANPSNPC